MNARWILAYALLGCGSNPATPTDAPVDVDVDAPAPDAADVVTREVTLNALTLERTPDPDVIVLVSDDGGPFQPVAGAGAVFRANVVGPRYSFARECIDLATSVTIVMIYNATFDDTMSIDDIACHSAQATVTLSGALVGVDDTHQAVIDLGVPRSTFAGPATDYSISAPTGSANFVASLTQSAQPRIAESLIIQRGLDLASPITRDLDFTTEGVPTQERTITIGGAGSGGSGEQLGVQLIVGTTIYTIEDLSSATDHYRVPAPGQLVAGDLLSITRATRTSVNARSIQFITSNPTDLVSDYPPVYPTAVIIHTEPELGGTLLTAPNADVYIASAFQFQTFTFMLQMFTARWSPGQAIDFTFPQLAGIGGWTSQIVAGPVNFALQASSATMSSFPFGGPTFVDNDQITIAASFGTVTKL